MAVDRTSQAIAALHPAFAELVLQVVNEARAAGIPLVIAPENATRTAAAHRANLAAGRSWTKNSRHLTGRAVDVDLYGWPPDAVPVEYWQWIGELAEAYGLVWGGRWKVRDWRHIELP